MKGKTVCYHHGGKSPGRPIKHGRYSKSLPKQLSRRYEEALADSELINQREHLAVYVALIEQKPSQMGDESHAQLWESAILATAKLKRALEDENLVAANAEAKALERILQNGAGTAQSEKEARELMLEARTLSETEIKRLEKMNQFVAVRELVAVFGAIHHAATQCIRDARDRQDFAAELSRIAAANFS